MTQNLTMNVADFPSDLTEEVLSRVPLTCLRKIGATCKRWNLLSKDVSFAKRHLDQSKEFVMVVMMDFRVYLMRVDLDNKSCIKREATLISQDDSHRLNVSQVFHCDGLLLCISEDNKTLVVWNPYWGHTRWIIPTHDFYILHMYSYALGYGQNNKSFKVLRFIVFGIDSFVEFKIYDLKSDSWRVLNVTGDWMIDQDDYGVSLKGNTYWFANSGYRSFLVCFDFTKERFGPRLPLPPTFQSSEHGLVLSTVREEQLAVLFQRDYNMEIWVTTKIEPNKVLWSSKLFLTMDVRRFVNGEFLFPCGSFLIDEEKKFAVCFDQVNVSLMNPIHNLAYIIGVDGSLKEVDLGKPQDESCYPLVCSYAPSLVQF